MKNDGYVRLLLLNILFFDQLSIACVFGGLHGSNKKPVEYVWLVEGHTHSIMKLQIFILHFPIDLQRNQNLLKVLNCKTFLFKSLIKKLVPNMKIHLYNLRNLRFNQVWNPNSVLRPKKKLKSIGRFQTTKSMKFRDLQDLLQEGLVNFQLFSLFHRERDVLTKSNNLMKIIQLLCHLRI